MGFFFDHLVLTPRDIDLARSPLAGRIDADTYVLGAFNPGMTRRANGNLLLMVRIAEALSDPIRDGHIHAIRWHDGGYALDAWPLEQVDTADPRTFTVRGGGWPVMALTSLSWLLPVELSADGSRVVAMHYDRAIAPAASYQCYGVEDARISHVGDRFLMTVCSVSPERQATSLYSSPDALDWTLEGLVLDHQNKDMLIFNGLIDGQYWAETRPLGDLYFAYPPGSGWRAGPSINLASSPDALHWKPCDRPFLRPRAAMPAAARMGGGAPPILTDRGWLSLWHGVEPNAGVGIYRTYWSLLDAHAPWRVLHTDEAPLIAPDPALTRPIEQLLYLRDIVFTTGIVDAGDHFIVASGEADLACRITHIPKARFGV
ncbi:glycosidase [Hephaestia sp. GCM10023244]|uniref:glycoside hydrolase family 130 protein n=1 Tax=unclassified Hephaestia TaxID=2631281 RepID=UPI0020776B70|nr:glycosidase [Hephaestia sp. MAHUQ-44]MCM8730208.1 glycosidase [Hephaestia sp. MAHUQ-44]